MKDKLVHVIEPAYWHDPPVTKPVQVCVKCGHADVAEDGTCAELLLGKQPLAGMVYCGCYCVFPVEGGGEVCPESNSDSAQATHSATGDVNA